MSAFIFVTLLSFSVQFAIKTSANAVSSTFTVTNTNPSGPGSFYDAVSQANSNGNPSEVDTIDFNIPGVSAYKFELPYGGATITEPVLLNGLTQAGSSCGHDLNIAYDVIQANVQGFNSPIVFGPGSDGSTIQGIDFQNRGSNGALVVTADNVNVRCNYFDMTQDGSNRVPDSVNAGQTSDGLQIYGDNITVGGPNLDDRNFFGLGFGLGGSSSNNLIVENNVMGFSTDFTNYFGPVGFGKLYNAIDGLTVKDNYFQIVNFVGNWTGNKNFVFTGNKHCVDPTLMVNVCEGQNDTSFVVRFVDGITIGGPNPSDRNYFAIGNLANDHVVYIDSGRNDSNSQVIIENNYIGTNQAGVAFGGSPYASSGITTDAYAINGNTRIKNNVVNGNFDFAAIGTSHAGDLSIEGNTIGFANDRTTPQTYTASNHGISIYSMNSIEHEINVNVSNNIQRGADTRGLYISGTSAVQSNYLVSTNTFRENGNEGIVSFLNPSAVKSFEVTNNFTEFNLKGIGTQTHEANVHDNYVANNSRRGISMLSGQAWNNTVENNGEEGFAIYGGPVEVHDNNINSNLDGIYIWPTSTPGTYIHNNAVTDNTQDGIVIDDAVGVKITDNTIANNGEQGVEAYGNNSRDAVIVKNIIHNNGDLGIDLGSGGVTNNDPNNASNLITNYPIVRAIQEGGTSSLGAVTPTATDTVVFFDVDLPTGDYRFDICNNPSGQDPSGHGECEVWLGSINANIATAGKQRLSLTIPGTGYDFQKLSMQATKRDALTDALSQSSEFGPAQIAQANLVVFSQVHDSNGIKIEPFPRVAEGSNLAAPGEKYLATQVCNSNNSADPDFARDDVTSFHLTTTLVKASFVSYQLRSENSSASDLGSIDQNGNWTGRLKFGECLNIAVNSTVTGSNGQNVDFTSTITSSGLDGGLINVDPQSSDDTYTIAVPINGEPDIELTSTQKTSGPITSGMDVEYEIKVTNIGLGSSTAGGYNFYVLLPAGASFDPSSGFSITSGPASLLGCSDLGEASTITPGLANYQGHVIACGLSRSTFQSGQRDTFKLVVTASNSFVSGATKSIAVVTADDESDTQTFNNVFGTGGDGLALNINNINHLTYDDTPLTVTINRTSDTPAQVDVDDACFIVEFNKPIWADSFSQDALTVIGQGEIYLFSQIDDQHWKVCVNGMKKGETVTLTMDANKVQDMSAIRNGAQVLGENTVRYVVLGASTNSGVTKLGSAAGKASASGTLAATGTSYLWQQFWSALILTVLGFVLLNLNSKNLRVLRFATLHKGHKS